MPTRSRPALLTLVVLGVLVVGGVGLLTVTGASPNSVVSDDTTALSETNQPATETNETEPDRLLSPESPTRDGYKTMGIDVAGVTASDTQRLVGQFERAAYDETYYSETLLSERRALAQEYGDLVDQRIEHIDNYHRDRFEEHGNEEISTQALLRELHRLSVATQEQQLLVEQVIDSADGDGLSLEGDIDQLPDNLHGELTILPRSVGDEVEAAMVGDREPVMVYTQATTDAVVFSSVVDETLVREATLREERDTTAANQFDQPDGDEEPIGNAFNRAQELYDWAGNINRVQGFGTSPTFLVESNHQYGELIAYLDGGTTNAFHELQELEPELYPISANVSDTQDDIILTVEATEATGPMQVSVVDNTTGEPVDGTVTVTSTDDQVDFTQTTVGQTERGELLTIQPAGSFDVSVTTPDEETISVSIPG